jgi:AraC-like DNA-binding protein
MVLRGGYREDGLDYEIGTVAYHPVGDTHANQMSPTPTAELYLTFRDTWQEQYEETLPAARIDSSQPQVYGLILQAWRELFRLDDQSEAHFESLCIELLVAVGRRRGIDELGRPAWFLRTLDYLEDEYTRALRLDALSRVSGVDPSHLVRTFRRHLGVTPAEYARNLRLGFASRELTTGHRPIAEIAQDAGYADQSHMGRAVRDRFGCTPSQLRKTAFGLSAHAGRHLGMRT